MNSETLLNAIGDIDDDLIEEARSPKKSWGWKHFAAAAAALAILIGSFFIPKATHSLITPIVTSPTEGLPLLPALSTSGFEQGFVGDPSSVESPNAHNADIIFAMTSVTAKAIETLPDTYSIIGERQYKFRLVRMELIRTLVGNCNVDSFYYILPENYMTDLTKYDTLVITQVRQFGLRNSILYNEATGELQVIDQVLLGYYTYLSGTVIHAFNNGLFDESLWYSTDVWTNEVGNKHTAPIDPTLDAHEQFVKENYGVQYPDWYPNKIHTHIEPENTEASAALDYVQPFKNGVFIPETNWYRNHRSSFYRRYANGYPTNETVYITPDSASYSVQFTSDELANLPDLASGLNTVNAAYDSGQITPPHLKGWEDMRFVRYVIFGWYEKTASGIYAVIRVSWCYADDSEQSYDKKIHYDDQYYIVKTGTNSYRAISHDELTTLINPKSNYILGKYGYDEAGRILPPYKVFY